MKETFNFPKFSIGIPTLNRWDLLRPTIWTYLQDFPNTDIYVLDNGHQQKEIQRPRIHYIDQEENIGVAASWNVLCGKIYGNGAMFAMLLNDDIYLGKNEYEIGNLLFYQTGSLFITPVDWSAVIVPRATFEAIGPFDEKFKAYYEDKDYEYRVKLSGRGVIRWDMLMPHIYRKSSTLERENRVKEWSLLSKNYYINKWGGLPGAEKFSKPFNFKK